MTVSRSQYQCKSINYHNHAYTDIMARLPSSELMTFHGARGVPLLPPSNFTVHFTALCNNEKEFASGTCACGVYRHVLNSAQLKIIHVDFPFNV